MPLGNGRPKQPPKTPKQPPKTKQQDRNQATYIASQVRTLSVAGVDAARRRVPVVAVIVTRALAVKLAVAVGDVTLEGL
jgi:hypothetical protein